MCVFAPRGLASVTADAPCDGRADAIRLFAGRLDSGTLEMLE